MAVETSRWGILYCPKAGIGRGRKQWERIQRALDERGVLYDFVQSENSESVERLMRMLINNGYKTIIVVGGDSALNDAVNCLMEVERQVRDSIVLGVIPNGVLNDFARFWNFRESEIQQTVDWLIGRRVRRIDLGCIRYTNRKGEKCHRYFLNCINVGLIADVMNLRRQTRSLLGSRTLSFLVSLLLMFFHRLDYKMDVKINSDVIRRRVMTMCIGSGPGYGQTPNAVPYNGMLDVSVVYTSKMTQMLAGMWLLLTGRFLNHRSVHPYRTREVMITEARHAMVGIDGRLISTPVGGYRITVETEIINFLIPT
ncbi:MAG: lipid kinase [Prevotella sp.]|nr:lipid kinase [Prevotella sp.]MDE6355297.1 lipid kinase [Prevotella sp.]